MGVEDDEQLQTASMIQSLASYVERRVMLNIVQRLSNSMELSSSADERGKVSQEIEVSQLAKMFCDLVQRSTLRKEGEVAQTPNSTNDETRRESQEVKNEERRPSAPIRTWDQKFQKSVLHRSRLDKGRRMILSRIHHKESCVGVLEVVEELLAGKRVVHFFPASVWANFFETCLEALQVENLSEEFNIDLIAGIAPQKWFDACFVEMIAGFVAVLLRHRGTQSMIFETFFDTSSTLVIEITRSLRQSPFVLRSVMLTIFPNAEIRRAVFKHCARVQPALSLLLNSSPVISRETLLLGYGLELNVIPEIQRRPMQIVQHDFFDPLCNLAPKVFHAKPDYVKDWEHWDEDLWNEALDQQQNLVNALRAILQKTINFVGKAKKNASVTALMLLAESGLAALMPDLGMILECKLGVLAMEPDVAREILEIRHAHEKWNKRKWAMQPDELAVFIPVTH